VLTAYLCGVMLAIVAALLTVKAAWYGSSSQPLAVGSLVVSAGLLWPVLVVAVVQFGVVAAVVEAGRAATRVTTRRRLPR
jgi:hypothetical protein